MVAAINPPIVGTDPTRKFSIDPRSHTDLQNPAEFSPKGMPIRNFSIDHTSFKCVIAQAFCSPKSFREITLNYAKLR